MKLTIEKLKEESVNFCKRESNITHPDLVGITDGKAVGTYIEHKFEEYLKSKYEVAIGSSARGIDLPNPEINTDIKVTSVKKPQSSSPFRNIEQKVYGLGHNLLIFVYEKTDINNKCYLHFKHCIFLDAAKSGDYNLTKMLRLLLKNNASKEDIKEVLSDANVPGDEQVLENLANKIISKPPQQGYLTISNAFQWRLKYNNLINSKNIEGISSYDEYNGNDLGDYQTPLYFTDIICEYLKNELNISPDIIIEPTCGVGNFLKSASKSFPDKQLYGIEIDKNKLDKINKIIPNLKLFNEDIFTFKFDNLNKNNSFLIIGNPPWITNTEFSKVNENITVKSHFKNLKKTDEMKINSNFDISEDIILKMIDEFKNTDSTIAFLCKTTVSRNIFIELIKNNIEYSFIKQLNFNSYKLFNIGDDACLFILQFGGKTLKDKICEVAEISQPSKTLQRFGFVSDNFYSNIDNIPRIDGKCQIEWRQGVKHDCANIMEIISKNNQFKNKKGDILDIENTFLYPLLKSGQLKKAIVNQSSKYVVITQKRIKQDTSYIKSEAPKTWKYLSDNKEHFDKRKSSIYYNTPNFSIFGIGDYSFKKYKVAIAGFSKTPLFSLVYNEKSMMLDDACYFLPFDDYDSAYITMLVLNSHLVKKFLENIAFLDSKRPFSKKVLKRIDLEKCLNILSFDELKETEKELDLNEYISQDKLEKYKEDFSSKYI